MATAGSAWTVGGVLVGAAVISAPVAAVLQRRAPRLVPWLQRAPYLRYVLPNSRDAPFGIVFALSVLVLLLGALVACAATGAELPLQAIGVSGVGVAAALSSVWVDGALAGTTDSPGAAGAGGRLVGSGALRDATARRLWLHSATGVVAGVTAALVLGVALTQARAVVASRSKNV